MSYVSPINLNQLHTPHPWVGVVDSFYDDFEIGDYGQEFNKGYSTKHKATYFDYDYNIDKIVTIMLDGLKNYPHDLKRNVIFLYDKDGIFGYAQVENALPSTPTNFAKGHYAGSGFNFKIKNKIKKNKRISLNNIHKKYIGSDFSLIDKKYYKYMDIIDEQNANILTKLRKKKFNLNIYSYFISFAHVAQSTILAKRLSDIFEVLGFTVWIDEKSLTYKNNNPIIEIKAGIKNSEKIIIILNKEYFDKSREWTIRELYEILTTKNHSNIKIIIVDNISIFDIKMKFLNRLREIDDFSKYISKEKLQKTINLISQIENIYYIDEISHQNIKKIISEL